METMFNSQDRDALARRLSALQPSAARQWGTMDAAQMLAHCAAAMEVACGDQIKKQRFIGRVLAPFVKASVLGEKPLRHNAPTDPAFRIADERSFAAERARLTSAVERFCTRGPSAADGLVHGFFGRMNGEEWGRLMYKHLDHHLRQFGA